MIERFSMVMFFFPLPKIPNQVRYRF